MKNSKQSQNIGCGNKADNLYRIKSLGYNVPDFTVFSIKTERAVTKEEILELIDKTDFDLSRLNADTAYAVRSSSPSEDSSAESKAGRFKTFLSIKSQTEILKLMKDCLKSQITDEAVDEFNQNRFGNSPIANVIVQEMVDADISGIAFGVNPVTGNDRQIVIEIGNGSGEKTVGGINIPRRYEYNYFDEGIVDAVHKELITSLIDIQTHFGCPIDIEFAVKAGRIYFLQARPVTKIACGGLTEHFTNANFRDGGVASSSCKALMWSLYKLTYDNAMKDFFVATKSFKSSELTGQIRIFCGRPYWNVTACKNANLKLPGFIERDYDEELGIEPAYEGKGKTSRMTLPFLISLPKIALTCSFLFRKNEKEFHDTHLRLSAVYSEYIKIDYSSLDIGSLGALFRKLITEDYYAAETKYFTQVFINIVRLSLFRRKILKRYGRKAYLEAISNIGNISHTKTYLALENLAQAIYDDAEAKDIILRAPTKKLAEENQTILKYLNDFMRDFGYHSDREVDISYPDYYEVPEVIIDRLKNMILSEKFASGQTSAGQERLPAKLKKQSYKIRKLLWQREELKDISTRFYSLVRKITLQIGKKLFENNIISDADDVFHLSYVELLDFLENKISAKQLAGHVSNNKIYYSSFKNYKPPNDIGNDQAQKTTAKITGKHISGTGCGGKKVVASARVLTDSSELGSIKPGEILVAKYFDVGWISSFKILAGTVTETGGLLCHSSIVSREYGLPAIVAATNATALIKTGDKISIDGYTGEIVILDD